ncbi:inhibitor of nuclear factor kappa-B kinase subunit alpha isoform X2 [Prorops nasuta]|uniref:inhibitor of nuclear factor kappa-B kinase subunit alpha isoform X2 n=1 Tax=Prorops nasuta TaxID=863751 RepID=UPI0034CFA67D
MQHIVMAQASVKLISDMGDSDWKYIRDLAVGGFGIIQLWKNTETDQKIAIKRCKWEEASLTKAQKERWMKEIKTMKSLSHPNVVQCIDLKLTSQIVEEMSILCMEYCEKGDLRTVLNKTDNCCGLVEEEAINAMKQILSAIEYLHSQKITHCDLKPENVALREKHKMIIYKLIDLGCAKDLGYDSILASKIGTFNYVAPELFWKKTYTCSVDYWSLGILFYEIVTGKLPFIPYKKNIFKWMSYISTKKHDDIRAFEFNGQIIFENNIEQPNNMSRMMTSKLVDWFKLVLEWDPKKRGIRNVSNSDNQCIVFELMRQILSKRIIQVFVAHMYTIFTYEADMDTQVLDLQNLIQIDTNINVHQQTITDYYGKILSESHPVQQIKYPVLFVFEKGASLAISNVNDDVPHKVLELLLSALTKLDADILHDNIRTMLFFMKREIYLHRLYIFALSIKMDILQEKFFSIKTSIDKWKARGKMINEEFFKDDKILDIFVQIESKVSCCKKETDIILDNLNICSSALFEFSEVGIVLLEGKVDIVEKMVNSSLLRNKIDKNENQFYMEQSFFENNFKDDESNIILENVMILHILDDLIQKLPSCT